jgi:hypothetical protein
MAGYLDGPQYQACKERSDNELDRASYNYFMNLNAVNRPNVKPTDSFGSAQGRDFYGPANASILKKEAFLQGRGEVLSNCPECEVINLPQSLFGTPFQSARPAGYCASLELERMQTRVPKSANSLSEAEISERTMFPGAYVQGYAGYNAVVNTFQQTRMMTLAPPTTDCGRPLSYATYGLGEASGRYGQGARMTQYQ